MNYVKKLAVTFLLIVVIVVILKFIFLSPKIKVNISSSDIIISTSAIKLNGEITSYHDGIYKITYFLTKDKKKLLDLYPEKVFMLKKYKKTIFDTTAFFNKDITLFGRDVNLTIYVKELLPKNVLRYKKVIKLHLPTPSLSSLTQNLQLEKNFSEFQSTKTSVVQDMEQKIVKEKTSFEKSKSLEEKLLIQKTTEVYQEEKDKLVITEKKEVIKEPSISCEIKISTTNFLPEYFYDEIIETPVQLKNPTNTTCRAKILLLLKNRYGIVITSTVFNTTLKPNEATDTKLQLKILDFILPDEYEIEYSYISNNKKYSVRSPKFNVSDKKPKISLTEIPTIKYKTTNTILAEISDDKGITLAQFVEVDPKTLKETSFPMTLIAGDKKFGLYSYTTPEIVKKGIYKFYIKAQDTSGNTVSTELYSVEIKK